MLSKSKSLSSEECYSLVILWFSLVILWFLFCHLPHLPHNISTTYPNTPNTTRQNGTPPPPLNAFKPPLKVSTKEVSFITFPTTSPQTPRLNVLFYAIFYISTSLPSSLYPNTPSPPNTFHSPRKDPSTIRHSSLKGPCITGSSSHHHHRINPRYPPHRVHTLGTAQG